MEKVSFNFQGRYYLSGVPGPEIKHVWFVFHGYGELAQYFIKKFDVLRKEEILIIAPEGLSKFYLKGFSGRVGATWMTTENRETDILNYNTYINQIQKQIWEKLTVDVSITVLGFSQGAATACRWAAQAEIGTDRLILWAGIFPPDLDMISSRKKFEHSKNYAVFGNEDPFITPEKFEEQRVICRKLGLTPEIVRFAGGHVIDEKILKTFQ